MGEGIKADTNLNKNLTPIQSKLNGSYVVKYRDTNTATPSSTGAFDLGTTISNETVIAVMPYASNQYLLGIYFMLPSGENYAKVLKHSDMTPYTGNCKVRVFYIE